ncbi:MAG: hypothetical protein FJX59_14365 [Alphaproteobacteria bacterium]|nr:hypothetical protein [Alphaproteobacteria bacterium]
MYRFLVGIAFLLALSGRAGAAVTESSSAGFTTSFTTSIAASPEAIWAHLIHPERWWSKDHSWSGGAANLSLDLGPNGCFCEKLPNGGFVEHARVIFAAPRAMLRLSGGLGPLQSEAIGGTLPISLKAEDGGKTSLRFDYVVGGHARFDLKEMAAAVDQVIGLQHGRLVKLVTEGKPD